MKKALLFLISFSILASNLYSQVQFKPFVQARILTDINFKKASNLSHLRLNISAGTKGLINRKPVWHWHDFYITPIFTTSFLVGKGLAASVLDKRFQLRPQFNFNLNFSTEWGKEASQALKHNIQGAVQYIDNGYYSKKENVVNLSTAMIVVDSKGSKNYLQRIGSIYVGLKRFSLNYYNDAAPFNNIKLADGFDRMLTGGGHISFNAAKNDSPAIIENGKETSPAEIATRKEFRVTFDRYTGYEIDSYEVGNALFQDVVTYRNDETRAYNRGMFTLGIYGQHFNGAIAIHDNNVLDVQYLIHKARLIPLHSSINRNPSFSLQGSYFKPLY